MSFVEGDKVRLIGTTDPALHGTVSSVHENRCLVRWPWVSGTLGYLGSWTNIKAIEIVPSTFEIVPLVAGDLVSFSERLSPTVFTEVIPYPEILRQPDFTVHKVWRLAGNGDYRLVYSDSL